MKSEMEIARAHDLITGIVLGEIPVAISPDTKAHACAALDALCWVLDHQVVDCGSEFQKNLDILEAAARLAGFNLERKP